jgi:hypothetical protein
MRRYSKNPRPLSPAVKIILLVFGLVLVLSRVGCGKLITSTTLTSIEQSGRQDTLRPDTQQTGDFVGSIKSNVYHYPSCTFAQRIYPENLITFTSVDEAKAKGYRPCKVCRPPG